MNTKKFLNSIVRKDNYSNLDDDDEVQDSFDNPSSVSVPSNNNTSSYQNQETGGYDSFKRHMKNIPLSSKEGNIKFVSFSVLVII
jgi:hypothetical protein